MTYYIEYVLDDGHQDAMEIRETDLAAAEDHAEELLSRYFGTAWRILGVRPRSGLILA